MNRELAKRELRFMIMDLNAGNLTVNGLAIRMDNIFCAIFADTPEDKTRTTKPDDDPVTDNHASVVDQDPYATRTPPSPDSVVEALAFPTGVDTQYTAISLGESRRILAAAVRELSAFIVWKANVGPGMSHSKRQTAFITARAVMKEGT